MLWMAFYLLSHSCRLSSGRLLYLGMREPDTAGLTTLYMNIHPMKLTPTIGQYLVSIDISENGRFSILWERQG